MVAVMLIRKHLEESKCEKCCITCIGICWCWSALVRPDQDAEMLTTTKVQYSFISDWHWFQLLL